MRALALGVGVGLALAGTAQGQELRAEMYLITPEAVNKPIGLVLITSTPAGAKFVADLQGLPPGRHGLHVHENGDCGVGPADDGTSAAGMAAGEHYDPERTGAHGGPEYRDAIVLQRIDQSLGQWRFRPHNDQVDHFLCGQRADFLDGAGGDGNDARQVGDARISRRGDQLDACVFAGECVGKCVFAAAGADEQDLHPAKLTGGRSADKPLRPPVAAAE